MSSRPRRSLTTACSGRANSSPLIINRPCAPLMPSVGRLLVAMDKQTFQSHLEKATSIVLPFTRDMLVNPLPISYLYLIFPNQSCDGNPLNGDEEVYPNESLSGGSHLPAMNNEEVVNHLWRNGKVPEWINISVHSYDDQHTYLELLCCGRFTAMKQLLYHRHEGHPPFHVVSPALPPNWDSVEKSGKFDLYWRSTREQQNLK